MEKKKMKNKNVLSIILIGCAITAIVYVVVVISMACRYGFFIADDFSHAATMVNASSFVDFFSVAMCKTVDGFMNLTGTYFSMFMDYFFEPLNHGGFSFLHAMLIILFLFFFCTIIFFFWNVFRKAGVHSKTILIVLIGCAIWSFFNYRSWSEELFWFTAANGYELPLACLLCMLTFFMIAHEKKKTVCYILSLVFAVGAMGGVLCVAFVGCYVLLLNMIRFIRTKTVTKGDIVVFVGGIALGAANCLAPGNFVRSSLIDSGINMNVFKGVLYACRTNIIQLEQLLKDTGFILVLLVVYLIGVLTYSSYEKKMWIDILIALTLPIVAVFPAIIGYRSPYMPERVLFIGDFFLIYAFISLVLQVGRSVSCFFHQHMQGEVILPTVTVMLLIVTAVAISYRIEDGEIYKLAKACTDGSIKGYYGEMVALDSTMRQSKGKKMVVNLPEPVDMFVEMRMGKDEDDPDYWINEAMCRYYGVESIVRRE